VAREGHPIFDTASLRLADVGQASWILPGPQVMARQAVEASFREQGLPPPTVVIESNSSIASLMSVVRSTDLLGMIGESTLKHPAGAGLRALRLHEARWPRVVGITTRRSAYLSPIAVRFIELLQTPMSLGRSPS
jgi:DNA-binding transcriptional LysR family regulator